MDIEKLLSGAKVKFIRHEHPVAFTAQELAAREHVSGNDVAKSVVVRADGRDVLCVLQASRKIDLGKLRKILSADNVTIAQEPELAGLFPDVELGAEPPFGEPYGLKTFVDAALAERKRILFAAGTHRQAYEMDYADYARLARPDVGDFSAGA